ncbi:MAG: hypothetical protein LBU60_06255 [Clostridiales bacterium]|jgi:hypothetical protein|nr:hypothetical protein [Clostridiales bacterium]
MKNWIKVILSSKGVVEEACLTIDRYIEAIALSALSSNAHKSIDKVISLLNRKQNLLCLKMLNESILVALDKMELQLVDCLVNNCTIESLRTEWQCSRNTVVKRIEKLYAKIGKILVDLGFTSKVFLNTYRKITFIYNKYLKFAKIQAA